MKGHVAFVLVVSFTLVATLAFRTYCNAKGLSTPPFVIEGTTFPSHESILMLTISLLVIAAMVYTVIITFKEKAAVPLAVLAVGAISKIIVAFSPSVLLSGRRATIFLYFSIILVALLAVREKEGGITSKAGIATCLLMASIGIAKWIKLVYLCSNHIGLSYQVFIQ